MKPIIPVMQPKLPKLSKVAKYLELMDNARMYSNRGPLLVELEKRLSVFFNVDAEKLVLCANATLALQGASFLMPSRDFYVPAYTFPATLSSVISAGKNLEICDINPDDWTIASQDQLRSKNHALIEVLPFGAPLNSKKNYEWDHYIVDAAASTGSADLDFTHMKPNWAVIFSLHATKVLGIGEGGVVIFGSKAFADEFRAWINFGFSGSRNSSVVGVNAKMSEISAAYGLATLDQWSQEFSEWNEASESATQIAKQLGIESITSAYTGVSPYWIADFGKEEKANHVENVLAKKGIETRRWWSFGCHKMPAFSELSSNDFPVTDLVANRTLGLPMFRDINLKDFDLIASTLNQALSG